MSLDTPTTQEISDNIIAQLEAAFSQAIPILPKSFFRVLSKVLAGVFILLYKYGGFMFLQMFVQTASAKTTTVLGIDVTPLTFWGRLIGVGDPVAATSAELSVDVTVETQVGNLNVGEQLISALNGVTYLTATSVALSAATVSVTIRAASDQVDGGGAGVIGNLEAGDIVSFANPIANVARDTVVTAQVVTGANAESVDAYRQRILDRFQKRPQGGAYSDYEAWGEEVAGILNVYPYTSTCPGQVDVYVEATVASSGSADGIPTTAQLEAVLDSIIYDENGLASRRPATALTNTFPITRTGFDITVSGLSVDNQSTVEANIETAIEQYFLEREPYIVGLAVPPRKDRITQSALGGVVEDVVSSAGGVFGSVVIELSSVVTAIYTLSEGEKAKALSITFT